MDGLVAPNYNPLCMIQTELDVLRDTSRRFTSGGITFMLTGSMAMNYYAQPRMTRDIDLVVNIASEQIDLLYSSEKRSIPSTGICETKAGIAERF